MGKVRDFDIAAAAKRLVDAGYHLGPSNEGFDCLTMLREFYGRLGAVLPPLPSGWTDDNYASRWAAGEGREELRAYLMSIGEEVDVNFARSGDLFIFDGGKWVFPGIYLGSGHALCAFERGVRVVPLRFFKHGLTGARRCLR